MTTYHIKSIIKKWDLKNKPVILRADLNVPTKDNEIIDDFRLHATIPTIRYLLEQNCTITLLTHLGRPKKNDPAYSTKNIMPWFQEHLFPIEFAATIQDAQALSTQNKPGLILVENLRFFPGETEQSLPFAQELAECGEYYINDAFGVCHRTDTSVTTLPELFSPEQRSIGFLIEQELQHLNHLKTNPEEPTIYILGGGKVETKLPLIQSLLNSVDEIMLCPAVAFTFLRAQNKQVGKSFVEEKSIDAAKKILKQAEKSNTALSMPIDYLVSEKNELYTVDAEQLSENAYGISIGPETIAEWQPRIADAGTLFFNGMMGFFDQPKTLEYTNELLTEIGDSQGYSIIAGGDTVAAVQLADLEYEIDFLSSGGGATLTYLSGKPLPALACFVN